MPENENPKPPLQLVGATAATAGTNLATTITRNGVDAAVEGEEQEEDQFDRLPDALIVEIFNKLFDVKSLFRCFSVCKRFASLVPQADTIFVPIPWENHHHHNHPILVRFQNLVNTVVSAVPVRFLLDRIVPTSWSPSSSSSSSSINHGPDRALPKFDPLRSLVIEHYPSKNCESLWIWHKSVIGARLDYFATVFASALHKNPHTINDDSSTLSTDGGRDLVKEDIIIRLCLDVALAAHRLAQRLIYKLPALCELVMSDRSESEGKMCMGIQQILELRNCGVLLSPSEVIGGAREVKVQKWRAPVLELPSCGCVMEKATVAVVRREDDDEEIVMERDLGFILGAFGYEGHGKVCNEAVNVAREKIAIDIDHHNVAASIKTHRLEFLEDQVFFPHSLIHDE